MIACDHKQIPGDECPENYSPMEHNITYHILILLMLIYMDCPPGLKRNGDETFDF